MEEIKPRICDMTDDELLTELGVEIPDDDVCRCQRCGTTEDLIQICDGEEYCPDCLEVTL